jgi:hypothetical protein
VVHFREALIKGKKPFGFYQAGDKQKIKSKRVCSFLSATRDAVWEDGEAQLKRVAYDVERAVGRLRENGLPEEVAAMRGPGGLMSLRQRTARQFIPYLSLFDYLVYCTLTNKC